MIVVNSAIPQFCIKLQEYKIANMEFYSIFFYSSQLLENKNKSLKSERDASRDFSQILIPCVNLGIYNISFSRELKYFVWIQNTYT